MCHLISWILPLDANLAQIECALTNRLERFDNPHVDRQLQSDEASYVRRDAHCDCGTAIGSWRRRSPAPHLTKRKIRKLRQQGWSEQKLQRAIEDSEQAAQQRDRGLYVFG